MTEFNYGNENSRINPEDWGKVGKTFEELKQEASKLTEYKSGDLVAYLFTEEQLTALLAAYDENKWKPYPENVPKKNGYYIVSLKLSRGRVSDWIYYESGAWFDDGNDLTKFVEAFQELPQPYTGKEE